MSFSQSGLQKESVAVLKTLAATANIPGRSYMNKSELIQALLSHKTRAPGPKKRRSLKSVAHAVRATVRMRTQEPAIFNEMFKIIQLVTKAQSMVKNLTPQELQPKIAMHLRNVVNMISPLFATCNYIHFLDFVYHGSPRLYQSFKPKLPQSPQNSQFFWQFCLLT